MGGAGNNTGLTLNGDGFTPETQVNAGDGDTKSPTTCYDFTNAATTPALPIVYALYNANQVNCALSIRMQ